ncbi:transposase [Paraferrimonas haliotis]|uniref:Transposase n=1 Tax=Paraferrimonas haliotis TaxID=2013866 RepID=A0AA37WVW8_9GAMM|nr:transposase [Paraferrimonas haliotis]GLS82878.1 transposase [Paraferrimonas haliotis]
MPRAKRNLQPNIPAHITHRGNNRQACFHQATDYKHYLTWMAEYAEKFGCAVHAYCLMPNHTHILMTPLTQYSISLAMHGIGQRYAQYYNRKYHRTGAFFERRFASKPIEHERYFLSCMRYIEFNPVKANITALPEEYAWSSYHCNGLGVPNTNITQHACYQDLGNDDKERQRAYQALMSLKFSDAELQGIMTHSVQPIGRPKKGKGGQAPF